MAAWRSAVIMMILCVASTCVGTEARPAQQVRLRGLQVSPPGNTSLTASEYDALVGLLGGLLNSSDTTPLTSVYRTSAHGTNYGDLLDRVGDAKPLVLVIRKDKNVFGVYVSAGIQLPDDPTDVNSYRSDVWYFSLVGHFPQPTKIEIPQVQLSVDVAGRNGSAVGANMYIDGHLWLGYGGYSDGPPAVPPAADIRSCFQRTFSDFVPEDYTGERDDEDDAVLAGSAEFMADEIEVLHVAMLPPKNSSLSTSEYEALVGLLNSTDDAPLTSLYRTSVHGTTYGDLLDNVGDAKPLVFVVKKDQYVFGAFINCGLELPDKPTSRHDYECGVWWFSLAGHFPLPTKMEIDRYDQFVGVAGREGSIWPGPSNMYIAYIIFLGYGWPSVQPAADIRSCEQYHSEALDVPEGYSGERSDSGLALLGGSRKFMADEIEVLKSPIIPTPPPPNGAPVSPSEYEALVSLLSSSSNGTTRLTSLYRASVHGTTYGDLLDNVGDAKPLVFVVRKDKYVFGAFINCGLELPEGPRDAEHGYECDLWHFSLSGHFPKPTKIDIDNEDQWVDVAARKGSVEGRAKLHIHESLYLNFGLPWALTDIRRCAQYLRPLPEGYTGVRDDSGNALLAGSSLFHADEIEILHVVDR
ncbi:unnamed protein product [Vitrella brassicaformis CCMP3155]|uniref:TLDc domain-containing protein n=1 Tax=Vitrella brassicaformis (strain CCMP3155) TaxID=1169540 RepID=A0A0G4EPZ3_VITBC|nr:unnamed protein product [Vitrella brassicaformis CCMP3155]|eukprot:CEL99668.1 unnamed protein product [Vitrella brassicaformis CCMP3155]